MLSQRGYLSHAKTGKVHTFGAPEPEIKKQGI